MNQKTDNVRKIVYLNFPPETSDRPMMCHLSRKFDLTFNILKARISPRREGHMVMELSGREEDFEGGLRYLREHGIKITPVAQQISRDEESCLHCGLCTALCPSKALYLDAVTHKIVFDSDKCTGCGMCTKICPVAAMNVEVGVEAW